MDSTQKDVMKKILSVPSPHLRPELSRSSTASSETLPIDEDPDTIVVDSHGHRPPQLATPAESTTTDAFLEPGGEVLGEDVSRGKVRRRSIVETARASCGKGRDFSGTTLVTTTSQSSLVRSGIAALDIPWSVTSLVEHGTEGLLEQSKDRLVSSAEEDERLRAAKASMKEARREQNAQLWEARKDASDRKASRRSSRAAVLERAGETVSDLTASILGKRPIGLLERGKDRLGGIKRRASLRPRSVVEPSISTAPAFEGPMAKIRRLSLDETGKKSATSAEAFPALKRAVSVRKDKRWLSSGLYTGQTRDFDGRLSESKNKRKRDAAPPIKENQTLPLPMFAGERIMNHGRDFKLPYNVFSPLPPGQPRPDEWRKTNKNVFVGDAAQVWRHSKPREHSTCMCGPETACVDDCMNRFMFYECDERNCNLDDCSNRSFQSLAQRSKKGGKYQVGVEVIQTRDRGFGVRSNRTFEPNQIIVEYTGEIITQDECDERMKTVYKDSEVGLSRTFF